MSLARFDRHAGAAMVEQIAGGTQLAGEVAAEIVERADGVPLFVEEADQGGGRSGQLRRQDREDPGCRTVAVGGGPVYTARPADGAARSPRSGAEGSRPDRRRDRARVFSPATGPDRRRGENDLAVALGRLGDAGLVFCRGTPPPRPTCSNMPSSATRPMRACCAAAAKSCMRGSPRCWKATSPTSSRRSPSSSPSISPKRALPNKRSPTGMGWNTISQRDTLAGVEPRPDEKMPAAGAGRSRTAHAASCSDVTRRVAMMDGRRPCPRSNPGARSGLPALLLCNPGST
jgi:hypothetical protein